MKTKLSIGWFLVIAPMVIGVIAAVITQDWVSLRIIAVLTAIASMLVGGIILTSPTNGN